MIDKITIFLFIISVGSAIYGLATNEADFIFLAVLLFFFDDMRRKYNDR